MKSKTALFPLFCAMVLASSLGCHTDMYDQAFVEEMEASEAFAAQQSARPAPPGAVPENAIYDPFMNEGIVNGQIAEQLPMAVTAELLQEGREHFNIFCAPCHGISGAGNGIIIQRGLSPPPAYHTQRLRQAPAGHLFRVVTYGYGTMFSYASRITPRQRWAIAAYIRALQLSQYAPLSTAPESERRRLEAQP